ncbi:MAG: DUF928 domain-containing protein [Microcoleaceae cyanobacterium]
MKWSNHLIQQCQLVLVFSLAFNTGIIPAFSLPLLGQSNNPVRPGILVTELIPPGPNPVDPTKVMQFTEPDMTGRGRPGNRKGGGSRGPCAVDPRGLIALVPNDGRGLTVSGHPTFWFRVPFRSENYHSIEFQLNEISNSSQKPSLIYETTQLATQIQPGILRIILPKTVRELEIEPKYYEWSLTLHCTDPAQVQNDDPSMVQIYGAIVRVPPDPTLAQEVQQATTERDRAAIYANHSLWFDSLTLLGNLNLTTPGAATLDWQQLLTQVGLAEIGTEPITDCCSGPSQL